MRNLEQLRMDLLAAGRRDRPTDRVPYAFEQRVMARVRNHASLERSAWAHWTTAFWRAGLSGAALAALLLVVDGVVPDPGVGAAGAYGALSRDALEETLMASADSSGEHW